MVLNLDQTNDYYPRTLCILTYRPINIPKIPEIKLFFSLGTKVLNVFSYPVPIKIKSEKLDVLSKFTAYLFNSIVNKECQMDKFSYFIAPLRQNTLVNEKSFNFIDWKR